MTPAMLSQQALAAWRRAAGRALHAPGCLCCGAGAIRLNPVWLGEDIEYALRTRYAAANQAELLALLDAGKGTDFAARIAAFGAAPVAPAVVVRLLGDIIAMLATIAPKPGFVAS